MISNMPKHIPLKTHNLDFDSIFLPNLEFEYKERGEK